MFGFTSAIGFYFYIFFLFPKIFYFFFFSDTFCFFVLKPKFVFFFSQFLRDHSFCRFKQLLDIWCVDYSYGLIEVSYNLLSTERCTRFYFKVFSVSVSSICSLYNSAGWLERENWDMFGIFFQGNYDLRRILSDYSFYGNPLRKSFPTVGFYEVRYDDSFKSMVWERVELSQDFRNFKFRTPWEYFRYGIEE